MVIFNSYVKLPEGKFELPFFEACPTKNTLIHIIPHLTSCNMFLENSCDSVTAIGMQDAADPPIDTTRLHEVGPIVISMTICSCLARWAVLIPDELISDQGDRFFDEFGEWKRTNEATFEFAHDLNWLVVSNIFYFP